LAKRVAITNGTSATIFAPVDTATSATSETSYSAPKSELPANQAMPKMAEKIP
jgi:hypothetical protein